MTVFIIFQKYSQSGTRPLGNLVGKYCINFSSFCIYGQKLRTDSSSYFGTLTRFTSFISSNFFFFRKYFLQKVFVHPIFPINYKIKLTCIPVANKVEAAPWNILWSHSLKKAYQITLLERAHVFLAQIYQYIVTVIPCDLADFINVILMN